MHVIRGIIYAVFFGKLRCISLKLLDKIQYQEEEASSISVAGSPEEFQDGSIIALPNL